MTHHLVVAKSFLNYIRGDIIADATKVDEILSTDYKKFVTKFIRPTALKG